MAEQLTRNEQVMGSSPISGFRLPPFLTLGLERAGVARPVRERKTGTEPVLTTVPGPKGGRRLEGSPISGFRLPLYVTPGLERAGVARPAERENITGGRVRDYRNRGDPSLFNAS